MSTHDILDAEQPERAAIAWRSTWKNTTTSSTRTREEAAYLEVAVATQARLRAEFYEREARRVR